MAESIGKLSIDLELADDQFKAAVQEAKKDVVEFGKVAEEVTATTARAVEKTDDAWQSLTAAQAEALRGIVDSDKASKSLAASLGVTQTQLKKSERAVRDLQAAEAAERQAALDAAQAQKAEATAAAEAAATASTAKVSYGNLGAQLADIGKGLASGVSPLTIATQQGDQLVGALASMGTVGLTVAGVLAGLTATVLAGAAAWKAYYEEENAAAEIAAIHREAQDALQDVLDDTRDTLVQIRVETGALTDLQGEFQKNSVAAMEAYADATEATRKRLAALHAEERSTSGQAIRAYADAAETVQDYAGVLLPFTYVIDAFTTSSEEAAREQEALTRDLATAAEGVKENRQAHDELSTAQDAAAAASKRHKNALKEEKDALDAWNAALKAENDAAEKNAKNYRRALDDIDAMSFGLRKNKSDVEALADSYHESLAQIQANEAIALAAAAGNADAEYTAKHTALLKSMAAQEAYYRDVEALRAKSEADAEEAARDRLKLEKATQKKQTDIFEKGEKDRQDLQKAYQAAAASIAGSFADAFGLIQENMTGISKKEALVLFRVQQALQLAQALLLAPAAVLTGLAQAGPAGGIAAGIAAAVSVAEIAAAKPPKFHTGGVITDAHRAQSPAAGPGEVAMVGKVGEGFLTAPAVDLLGGAAGLAALEGLASAGAGSSGAYAGYQAASAASRSLSAPVNRAAAPAPSAPAAPAAGGADVAPQTVIKVGNRAFNAMVSKALSNPGPLRDATTGTGPRRVSPYVGKV